jgi:hypothetical protein
LDQSDNTDLAIPSLNDGGSWDLNTPGTGSITENSSPFDLNYTLITAKTTPEPSLRYYSDAQASDPMVANTTQSLETQATNILPRPQLPTPCSRGMNDNWHSTLHIAAQKGHDRIARLLIEQNMDCNERDSDGRTPLMYAVIENHESIVNALIWHGARSNVVDNLQRSVLHLAVLHRRENVLRDLLEACPDRRQELEIDGYDSSGRTPLHLAVEEGFESGVVILLRNGANMNVKARKPLN